jgi:hypothetical protein
MSPRTHERVERRLAVDIQSEDQTVAAIAPNLSLGGMFLETPIALKERARIKLRFVVPTQAEPMLVDAEVRWSEPGGAGVCFLGLRAKEMWALTKFLGIGEKTAAC